MSTSLASRNSHLSESVTLVITATATRMREEGIKVANLSVGEPDFPTPDKIKRAGLAAIENDFTRYTAGAGILELRKAIQNKLKEENNLEYGVDQIVVTSGAKHALSGTMMALVNEGEEVLFPSPGWLSYPEQIRIAGGIPVPYNCPRESGFRVDYDDLEKAISPKTKAIILNTPNNPTGAAYSPEEVRELGEYLAKKDIWLISDEIYEKLRYDGKEHLSFAAVDGLYDKTVTINGVSKAFCMTGWRIGYLAAPKRLASAVSKIQSQMTSSTCSISQKATVEALNCCEQGTFDKMMDAFTRRRKLVVDSLNSIPNVFSPEPEGAFYAFPDIKTYLGKKAGDKVINTSVELCQYLLEDYHVALVPGAAFGSEGYIRISFANSEAELERGLKSLRDGLLNLK
jgi:aspartate aminotransferase